MPEQAQDKLLHVAEELARAREYPTSAATPRTLREAAELRTKLAAWEEDWSADVVLVWFPNSDHVTFKHRPALVGQADNLKTALPQTVTTAPITAR